MNHVNGLGARLVSIAALFVSAAGLHSADAPGPFPPASAPRPEGPLPPGDDPFQKKTIWQGVTSQKQTFRFVIQERTGNAFKGFIVQVPDQPPPPPKPNPFGPSRPSGPPAVKVEGTVKGAELSFEQVPTKAGAGSFSYQGKYEKGVLKLTSTFQPAANPKKGPARPPAAPEAMTGEFTFRGNASGTFPDFHELQRPLAADDPKAAARELARLMSFQLFSLDDRRLQPITARLWLPYRSVTFAPEGGEYTAVADAIRQRLDAIAAKAPAPWRAAAVDARIVLNSRLTFARFNQQFGNTPDASLSRDLPKFVLGMLDASNELNQALNRDRAEGREGASAETLKAAAKFAYSGSPKKIADALEKETQGGLPPPLDVTRYMTNADIHMAHHQAKLWADHLIPVVEAANLPKAAGPLVQVDPVWATFDKNTAQGLSMTAHKNVSGRPLTNVVLEFRLANEYGEATTTYHYVEYWAADAVLRVAPHPAWGGERTYHMGQFTGHVSVWSDQGKTVRQEVKIVNPKLTARAKDLRKQWTDSDDKYWNTSMWIARSLLYSSSASPRPKP